jgi:DHA3 family tetracycline resistance protein-like MFS transporter
VARILMGIDGLFIATMVVFALSGRFWAALVVFWVVMALRNAREPVFTAWINQGLDPKTRATINSMGSQADAVGQAAGGLGLGRSRRGHRSPRRS